MKNNIVRYAAVMIVITCFSCKKNDKAPEQSYTQNTASGTSSSSNITPSNATNFSGIFTTGNYTSVVSFATFSGYTARAYLATRLPLTLATRVLLK